MRPEALTQWPLPAIVALFVVTAIVIALVGTRLSRLADRLADTTGLGEALFGAILLGGTTSLSGIATSVTAAAQGYAELAISNAIGGIAAQTVFLAVADMAYRRANLEHAAASIENLMQGAMLGTLLAIPLLAMSAPEISVLGVHPGSLVLLAGYAFGLRLVAATKAEPLWHPRKTDETRQDQPVWAYTGARSTTYAWMTFVVLAGIVAGCGFLVAQTGIVLVERTGLSQSLVGVLLTALATSLPELVTSIAAVRQGALTLAVGGIIGGNCFDVLFIAFSDIAYREGSIYHAISERQVFLIALSMLLTGLLLLGLLRREKRGIGNIGFESFLLIVFYIGAMIVIATN